MKTRILVAAIGLPLLLVVVLALPSVATAILLSAMCVIGCYELFYGTGLCRHIRIFFKKRGHKLQKLAILVLSHFQGLHMSLSEL